MDKFQQFELKIANMGYIGNPYDFIYENEEDLNSYELLEFVRIVHYHNQEVTKQVRNESSKINSIIESAQPLTKKEEVKEQIITETVDNSYTYPQDSQTEQVIKSLEYFKTREEFENNIKGISEQGIYKIKLHILSLIIKTTKKIQLNILRAPLNDLTELQLQLLNYQEFLEVLKVEQVEKTNEVTQKEQEQKYNIIIVPDNKSSTYLFEDIIEYPEAYEEITLTFDNVMSQKMFSSKSIRQIRDKSEKLWEYKRKNGIRVMFIKNGNNVFITSLFYKDKTRSIKIDNLYDEAIRRFNNFVATGVDYTSVDFAIEQKELIGTIYGEIETGITYKKVGDIND